MTQVLDKGFIKVTGIDGDDARIVNAARVSFGKEVETVDEKDIKLLDYLAKNKHYSPFRHCQIAFHIKMPIFVMRQFVKHRIGVEINEISGRYTEFQEGEYYIPSHFRAQSKDNKQGSEGVVGTDGEQFRLRQEYVSAHEESFRVYKRLIEAGVAKEMARMVLPVSIYTEIRVTMGLQAVSNFIALRDHSHAQWEIREYAIPMKKLTLEAFPQAFAALMKYQS